MNWKEYTTKILISVDNEAYFTSVLSNIKRHGHEIKAECPFKDLHEGSADKNPSLTVNVTKGVYYCNTCHSKGNIHTMYRALENVNAEEAWFALGDELGVERPDGTKPTRPDINIGLIPQYHQALMGLTGSLRKVLRERRGFVDSTLQRFQLGWDGERVTIPVYDEYNTLVNIRRYKWNSHEDQFKVLNYQDELGNSYGEVRIYGLDSLLNDEEYVVWAEGETDRILAEQYGFNTACPTSGAGTFKPEWLKYFKEKKRVYLAQDNDDAGRSATIKLCEKLHRVTEVYVVQWPEDFTDKGDITDFFTKSGQTAEDFQKLLDNAIKYVNPDVVDTVIDTEYTEVPLAESSSAKYYGDRIAIPVMVSGKDSTPYVCPKKVYATCGDNYSGDQKRCANCSLAAVAGERNLTLKSKDKGVLNLIKCSEEKQMYYIYGMLGVNKKCEHLKVSVEEYMNLEELRLIPKADANFGFNKDDDYVVRTGFFMGNNLTTNKRYALHGYMYPEPNNQYASYIFDTAVPEKDAISDFELNEETIGYLKLFQQKEGQRVEEKFNEIHMDLERNVTYVWERRYVAIGVDLIYHTVLNFYFQQQFVKRGWGELLIIGDSGQAKTTIVERLMAHYGLGELHSGESSRRTGLVYSLQQNNKRWFLVWGAFPLNDGGLLTIDELSGLSEEDLSIMSDVRSSGVAKTTGVITAETKSRTRAIYISNPRNGRQLNVETYGANSILKLFGKAEDVRRLDLAITVASGEVDASLVNLNLNALKPITHKYTSDACNTRVLWAWSRRPDDVVFLPETTEEILKAATEMGRKYSAKVPIVEAADQRTKIARLSVACAVCVVSTDEEFKKIIVKPEHVRFVVNFMHEVYGKKSFGYDKLSAEETTNCDGSTAKIVELRRKFLALPLHSPSEIAQTIYGLPYFSRATLEDYTGLSRDDLRVILKYMTTNHLVEKSRGDYRRLPLGTQLFENMITDAIYQDEITEARKGSYTSEF